MFISVATMMLWAVVNPVPELERIPTGPLLMIYVFTFGIPTTAVSAFITLSDEMLYSWYELAPRVTALTPLEDQRLGGLIMWIPGMLIFWVAISIVFFRWTKDEYRGWKAEAEELVGYGLYIDLLGPLAHGKTRSDFPLGGEEDRCRYALEQAGQGKKNIFGKVGEL